MGHIFPLICLNLSSRASWFIEKKLCKTKLRCSKVEMYQSNTWPSFCTSKNIHSWQVPVGDQLKGHLAAWENTYAMAPFFLAYEFPWYLKLTQSWKSKLLAGNIRTKQDISCDKWLLEHKENKSLPPTPWP